MPDDVTRRTFLVEDRTLGNGRWLWVALAFAFELVGYAGTARTNRDRMGGGPRRGGERA